ncbi:hypothetical protein EBU94_04500 [bacterium]|nr:hypothetical protein [bacterium]
MDIYTYICIVMKDTIFIIDLDEETCIATAVSKTDNQVHHYDVGPWVLSTYLKIDYEVEIRPEGCEDPIDVLSFKEVEHHNKFKIW